MNILLLMMAGSGIRYGADIPKQFVEVEGKPVFSYILKGYDSSSLIDHIIVVTHPDWLDFVEEWKQKMRIRKICAVVAGGDTRSESVRNGLIAAFPVAGKEKDAVVLIHDATHPYVDEKGTEEVIRAVHEYGGATLAERQYDTVYQIDSSSQILEKVVPREKIVSGASPEAFFFHDLYRIYMESTKEEMERMTSAGAIALHHGIRMKAVDANVINLKITYKNDMEGFRYLVHKYFPETV